MSHTCDSPLPSWVPPSRLCTFWRKLLGCAVTALLYCQIAGSSGFTSSTLALKHRLLVFTSSALHCVSSAGQKPSADPMRTLATQTMATTCLVRVPWTSLMLAHTGHLATPNTQGCAHRLHCKPALGTFYCQSAVSVLLQGSGQQDDECNARLPANGRLAFQRRQLPQSACSFFHIPRASPSLLTVSPSCGSACLLAVGADEGSSRQPAHVPQGEPCNCRRS